MPKQFSEIVIDGPFLLVKGFMMGYKYSCNPSMEYFFHRKTGIRRETLKDLIQEYFELESHTHLCLESGVLERFTETINASEEQIKLKILSRKIIETASFSFHFEVFSKEAADKIRNTINTIPSTLHLNRFKDDVFSDDKAKGIELYAPLHDYIYSGKGELFGDFEDLIHLYREFNKSGIIETGQVKLQFPK